jgi:hypothetical protein
MPMPHRPDIPCETQELPNLHAPGGPIAAFPILKKSPGSVINPPAPVPQLDDIIGGANDYLHNVLPQVAKENAAYQRREARLLGLEAGR